MEGALEPAGPRALHVCVCGGSVMGRRQRSGGVEEVEQVGVGGVDARQIDHSRGSMFPMIIHHSRASNHASKTKVKDNHMPKERESLRLQKAFGYVSVYLFAESIFYHE